MVFSWSIISTIVRYIRLTTVRLGFLLGSRLWPQGTARAAGKLFSTPASSRARAIRQPNDGATESTFDSDGLSIAVYAWGDPGRQPYVLFAHGWSSHGKRIHAWLPALRALGYAVVAFDQAGHGKSGGQTATLPGFADLLLEIGRRFGPAKAVIGHSLGGAAVALALDRGLAAERAILIAPAADPVDAAHRFARFVWLGEYLCRRMFAIFEARLGISFAAQQAHLVVPRIALPALIVHDIEDRDVSWAEGERYARYWPQSRLLSTRGLGHRRIVDDADVIAAGIGFLQGHSIGERVVSSPNLPYGVA